jgi:hypothetical protein
MRAPAFERPCAPFQRVVTHTNIHRWFRNDCVGALKWFRRNEHDVVARFGATRASADNSKISETLRYFGESGSSSRAPLGMKLLTPLIHQAFSFERALLCAMARFLRLEMRDVVRRS